jgi:hypothetical protein
MRLRRKAGADGLQHEAFARIKAEPRRFDLVARRKQACAKPGQGDKGGR